MTGIDRDALAEVIYECGVDALSDGERLATAVTDVKIARQIADAVLALVRPFTRDQVRTELLASLPTDPKWATWVDGVLDRLEEASS